MQTYTGWEGRERLLLWWYCSVGSWRICNIGFTHDMDVDCRYHPFIARSFGAKRSWWRHVGFFSDADDSLGVIHGVHVTMRSTAISVALSLLLAHFSQNAAAYSLNYNNLKDFKFDPNSLSQKSVMKKAKLSLLQPSNMAATRRDPMRMPSQTPMVPYMVSYSFCDSFQRIWFCCTFRMNKIRSHFKMHSFLFLASRRRLCAVHWYWSCNVQRSNNDDF